MINYCRRLTLWLAAALKLAGPDRPMVICATARSNLEFYILLLFKYTMICAKRPRLIVAGLPRQKGVRLRRFP